MRTALRNEKHRTNSWVIGFIRIQNWEFGEFKREVGRVGTKINEKKLCKDQGLQKQELRSNEEPH